MIKDYILSFKLLSVFVISHLPHTISLLSRSLSMQQQDFVLFVTNMGSALKVVNLMIADDLPTIIFAQPVLFTVASPLPFTLPFAARIGYSWLVVYKINGAVLEQPQINLTYPPNCLFVSTYSILFSGHHQTSILLACLLII